MGTGFFCSNENNEPAHIHVQKGSGKGKIWLEPELKAAWFNGFTNNEIKFILQQAEKYQDNFKTKWNEYFGK